MIETFVQAEGWPEAGWEALAERAVSQALSVSPYAVFLTLATPIEIAIRLASDADVQALNKDYREKDKPTNVLSFPMLEPEAIAGLACGDESEMEILLGDIILAHETCVREAAEKNVPLTAHATHLIVHGTLHLLGYDHIGDDEANEMETLERKAMAALGLHDPYDDED